MLNTNKKHIRDLASICAQKGMKHVVISPGSRCAPLVIAFNRHPNIQCHVINDERSAAFYAMGMAQAENRMVGLICTSGSAVLNYAPAVAEAYYQNVPLVLLTADRPNEWIDQGENQSIRQEGIFRNYSKASYALPVSFESEKDVWYSARMVNEALNKAMETDAGPVHINIPLREPLYDLEEVKNEKPPRIIESLTNYKNTDFSIPKNKLEEWRTAKRIWIISGWHEPSKETENALAKLLEDQRVVAWKESTSHLNHPALIDCIDPLIEWISNQQNKEDWLPDLVITFGGGLVSKKLKFLLRKHFNGLHWHLSPSGKHWDNLQSLSSVWQTSLVEISYNLTSEEINLNIDYQSLIKQLNSSIAKMTDRYLAQLPFCDFTIFKQMLQNIPEGSNLLAGNSTPIRYLNLFSLDKEKSMRVFANRGVSGIDGQTSTACGLAAASNTLTYCITGDIAFLYDSNALWNHSNLKNLRIIVINNGGGNIFRIIPGPGKLDEMATYFETPQQVSIPQLVASYGHECKTAKNENEVLENMQWLAEKSAGLRVLEIQTPGEESANALREYFTNIKTIIPPYESLD